LWPVILALAKHGQNNILKFYLFFYERGVFVVSKEDGDIERATEALLLILKANAIERFVYLGMSVMSFIVLLVVGVWALMENKLNIETFLALFAATGVIGLCVSRILVIWRDCMEILKAVLLKDIK